MFLDAIESFLHAAYGRAVHLIADVRQKALQDQAVVMAYLAKERRQIMEALAREEAKLLADYRDLEAKVAKAETIRSRVEDFLNRL